jgi:hypothetical protein
MSLATWACNTTGPDPAGIDVNLLVMVTVIAGGVAMVNASVSVFVGSLADTAVNVGVLFGAEGTLVGGV